MKIQSYIIAYLCLPQRNDAITAEEGKSRKIVPICRGSKTLKIEKVFTDNPKTHLADLLPLCTAGKFGCQFGFESGDLSLILCAFFFVYTVAPGGYYSVTSATSVQTVGNKRFLFTYCFLYHFIRELRTQQYHYKSGREGETHDRYVICYESVNLY